MPEKNDPPLVYVIHEPMQRDPVTGEWTRTRDISAAFEFGQIERIFPAGRLTQDPTYLVNTAREKLKNFRACDYLLLSGDTAAIAIAATVAAQQLKEDETRIQYLVWDNRTRRYSILKIEVWEEEAEDEYETL